MQSILKTRSIFMHWHTTALIAVFFGLRILSFVLFEHNIIQAFIMFALLMAYAVIYFQNVDWAWYILLAEIFLGGSGHLLEFFGLSLRSMIVFTFLVLWILHHVSIKSHQHKLHIRHQIFYLFIPLTVFVSIGVFLGIIHAHSAIAVFQDALPFAFFALILPFYHHLKRKSDHEFLTRLMLVFIFGTAVFALFNFVLFAGGLAELQAHYYDWMRNVNMAKITAMSNGFFRIVSPEHLLIVPSTLLIASLLMRDEKHHPWWRFFLIMCLLVLVLNFSRTYFLALAAGLLILKYKHSWKQWVRITSTTVGLAALLLVAVVLPASRGTSFGFEMLTSRFAGLADPSSEVSTYARSALVNPLVERIIENPLFGSGFGSTISFIEPNQYQQIETRQLEWGYLELLVELGLLGTMSYLLVLGIGAYELVTKIELVHDYHDFYVGLLAAMGAFFVMGITSPVLYHFLGVFFFVLVFSVTMKPLHLFDNIISHLYQIFHHNPTNR